MTASESRVDQIIEELMQRTPDRQRRIELLRELVASGNELPDEVLDEALLKLMERLTD